MLILQFDTPTLSALELNDEIEESESDVSSVYYNENLNYIGHCVTEVRFNPHSFSNVFLVSSFKVKACKLLNW